MFLAQLQKHVFAKKEKHLCENIWVASCPSIRRHFFIFRPACFSVKIMFLIKKKLVILKNVYLNELKM